MMTSWKARDWALAVVVLIGAAGGILAEPAKFEAPAKKEPKAAVGGGEKDAATRDAIEAVFRTQVDAWNRGDARGFMDHYWKSDDLTFSSGGKTTCGWQATLDRYRQRYPTREKMGRLTLDGLEITPLGNSASFVLGQWKLDRGTEPVQGSFTLVEQPISH